MVSNPPRLIQVFAFADEAEYLELEAEQIDAALSDADFWVYVVEHAASAEEMTVTRLGGEALRALMETRVEYRWAEIDWPGAGSFAEENETSGQSDITDAVSEDTADVVDAEVDDEAAVVAASTPEEGDFEAAVVAASEAVVDEADELAAQEAQHAALAEEVEQALEGAFDAEPIDEAEVDAEQQEASAHLERAFAAVGATEGVAPQAKEQPKRSRWFF